MGNKYKKKLLCKYREAADIGFVLVVFGLITVCAFFLPAKVWILLLGIVLVTCGCILLGK